MKKKTINFFINLYFLCIFSFITSCGPELFFTQFAEQIEESDFGSEEGTEENVYDDTTEPEDDSEVQGSGSNEQAFQKEACDGFDNDNNGMIDEGLGETECGEGICKHTIAVCLIGIPQTCDPFLGAQTEICDDLDNDCDGEKDDGLTFDIDADGFTVINSCHGSKDDCNDNDPNINPSITETCNGIDENCDGLSDEIDEDNDGFMVCEGDCNDSDASINPSMPDICNGIDDDCDIKSADGSEEFWFTNLCDGQDSDLCMEGTLSCDNGKQVCSDNTDGTEEICDGNDNDCDGDIDEGFADSDGDGIADCIDNCPKGYDIDSDGVCDVDDNCVDVYNPDQLNTTDTDNVGDACDNCMDEDGPPENCGCALSEIISTKIQIVFVMDTSGSMKDEFEAVCENISLLIQDAQNEGISLEHQVFAIINSIEGTITCLADPATQNVKYYVKSKGYTPKSDHNEDWGPGTYDMATYYDWKADYKRVIIPMGDEGPNDGCSSIDDSDYNSIDMAIAAANANDVTVFPIIGNTLNCNANNKQKVLDLALKLAEGTGGKSFRITSTDPTVDVYEAIKNILLIQLQLIDFDEDGFYEGCDCSRDDYQDDNASINPDAEEICTDQIDNNCNELIDAEEEEFCPL